MKANISLKLLAAITAFIMITASLAGCAQKTQPAQPSATPSSQPSQAQQTPQTQESPRPQETSTGPELNMLDVVALKDTDAYVIVRGTEEITKGDYLDEGQKYISVWVFVKNTGAETLRIEDTLFTLVDTDETEYEASSDTPGVMYDAAYVLPGGIVEGPVYFAVPEDATAYSLKAPNDLIYDSTDSVEIDLQEASDDPGDDAFAPDPEDALGDLMQVDLNTPFNYDDRLSITVTDGYFTTDDMTESTAGYSFYQVAVTVENLTGEELDVTLDYDYLLYSQTYNCLMRQISLPFTDNEMWVETLLANEKKDFVLTFEVKTDSEVQYLHLQDFFEDFEPLLFVLPA